MASIGNDSGGRKRILFVANDGSRKTVRLGKCSAKTAEAIRVHVEALADAKARGVTVPRETALWVVGISDALHDRLHRAGLVEKRISAGAVKLDRFIGDYLAQRVDVKPATMAVLQQARRHLVETLGDVSLAAVTSADGDRFRAAMIGRKVAKSTLHKWQRYARHFMEVAKRRKLIPENPFAHLKGAVKGDPARRRFVPAADVQRVMHAATDPQWKLLIALARWGGLRIPSEALALKWGDVDFENMRFTVRASKTEHHDDGGVRITPIFPELYPHLRAVYDAEAPGGAVYVITRYRDPAANLRTQLNRFIVEAGLKPWPKPWQNMRASRATELADLYPSHVPAAWLGHSEIIANTYYRQVTEDHFKRASAAHKAAQSEAAGNCQDEPAETKNGENSPVLQVVAATGSEGQNGELGVTGLEPVTLRV